MISSQIVAVERRRPEVLADTLDEVRAPGAAGVHRAFRVGTDHAYPPAGHLLQVAPDAADRAAGADAGDEVGDPALGLLPYLRAGRLVVRPRVVRVGVLVRLPAARYLAGQPVGHRVVRARILRGDRSRTHDHLGAIGPQRVDLVAAHLVRAHEHAVIAALLRDDRETDPGVAGGRFDDRPTRPQLARLLGGIDHPHRDAVLHRAAGIEVLDLGQQRSVTARP